MEQHALTYPDTDGLAYARARYHYLLQILFGETMAIDYCRTIAGFAPNEDAKNFLLKQQIEEDIHLELLTEYVGSHIRPQVTISPFLKKLDKVMADAIERRDYVASIFVQNFIVEGLNVSLLQEVEHHADGVLSEICTKILKDEEGHTEFGITEVRRILNEDPSIAIRKKLTKLQRETLIYGTGLALTLSRESKDLGIPMSEFAKRAVYAHFERIERAGLPLPLLDKVLFNCILFFLTIF